ncbi:MAG TPA: phytoene desaturase [Ignavibacteria bacterium]|nr:phytoene desaturase [Ignavibacteria bacterium]
MKIAVIGSGFGGLASAVRLQKLGFDVTLYEKRDKLGGRAYVYEKEGYKFDGGPTVITAPWLFNEIFEEAGKNPKDYYNLIPVEPFYKIFFNDGSSFNYNGNTENIINEINKFSPEDVAGYKKFIDTTKDIFETGFKLIDKPFHNPVEMMKILPELVRLRSDKSVYQYVSKYIKNDKLRQVFSFHSLLIGGNPFQSTNIYTLIHYLEKKWGVWYAEGGTGSLVNALAELFKELGGKILLNTEIDEILINDSEKKNKVKGIRLKTGDIFEYDIIVSNSDVAFTYKNMINSKYRKKYTDAKIEKMKYSMSLFVYYFGTSKKYDNIPHHSIILGERYRELLDDIFNRHILADDFSLYLHRPTATDNSMAPKGCDSFYVLSPVPHLKSGTDWNKVSVEYKNKIINHLEKYYLPELSKNITVEHYIDPLHFRDELNSHLGSAFSVEPILTQSAYLRPHNKSEDIENLYFTGAGTHPGAGLPGVLSSAKIVEKIILQDQKL